MFLALLLPFATAFSAVFASPLYNFLANRHHHDVMLHPRGDLAKRDVHTNVRATWYDAGKLFLTEVYVRLILDVYEGLTACGVVTKPSDFIVAISPGLFGPQPGKYCHDGITITNNGKTAHAAVMDLVGVINPRKLFLSSRC